MHTVLSYGGGLDSFAALVKACQLGAPPEYVVFCDVGDPEHIDPAEWDGTYRHIEEVVKPFCAERGVKFITLDTNSYPIRDARSLFAWMLKRGQIPVAGPNRICTTIAKVERFESWLTDTFPGQLVEVWVGFEAGEEGRAEKDPNAGKRNSKPKPGAAQRVNRFPLIEWGLCRCRCEALVREAGYPVPRKSACVFCPYGSLRDWQTFAKEKPDQFAKVVELEATKPPTGNGFKLSIMAFRKKKDATGKVIGVRAPPLPEYIKGKPIGKGKPCKVCGAAVRTTKATGCGYLPEAA